jgi:hypothetical protein
MAPTAPSPQRNRGALFSNRNDPPLEVHQGLKGSSPFDEAVTTGIERYGDNEDGNFDDDISVSESGSTSTISKSGGSENSPSMRSSEVSSVATPGVLSKITGQGNEEDRRICGARCLFFFVLVVAAVSLGTMVFMITSRDAQGDFEDEVSEVLKASSIVVAIPCHEYTKIFTCSLPFCNNSSSTPPSKSPRLPTNEPIV